MAEANSTWAWLLDLHGGEADDGTPHPTPKAISYIRKLGFSTKAEIERVEGEAKARDGGMQGQMGEIKRQMGEIEAAVSDLPLVLPLAVAKEVAALTIDAAHQEREDNRREREAEQENRQQSREAKLELAKYVFGRFFSVMSTLVANRMFTWLAGVALVIAAAGVFAGQTGVLLSREGLILDPSGEVHNVGESHSESTP